MFVENEPNQSGFGSINTRSSCVILPSGPGIIFPSSSTPLTSFILISPGLRSVCVNAESGLACGAFSKSSPSCHIPSNLIRYQYSAFHLH